MTITKSQILHIKSKNDIKVNCHRVQLTLSSDVVIC
jgi:hypothetical protein